MSNVLFLHHFEAMWSDGLAKFGTTIEEQTEKVLDFLEHNEIDEVILTRFDDFQIDIEQEPIKNYCDRNGIDFTLHIYGYGMHKEHDPDKYVDEDYGITWCQGTRGHHDENDVLDIEDFHTELKNNNSKVYLAGAFEDECVLDQEAIFDEIGVNYEKVNGLVVGDGYDYEFQGQTLSEFLETLVEKYEAKLGEVAERYFCNEAFDELIYESPDEIESIIDEFKEELENDERVEGSHIMVSSCYQELSRIVEAVSLGDDYEYDLVIENIEEAKEVFSNTKQIEEQDYYHGTFWDKPESKNDESFNHTEITTDHNDDEAVYFSNGELVAERFAHSKVEEGGIPVVMKLSIELEKAYVHNSNDTEIKAFDTELDLSDREELYSILSQNDYDAFIIPHNYPEGSDIAYFNDVDTEIDSAKAFINNKWTEYMPLDELKEQVLKSTFKNKNKSRSKLKI